MNPQSLNAQSPDDRQLERLLDGELSEAERRAVLLQLESEPDGWRRCALAMLEAQCWKEALGPLAGGRFREAPTQPTPGNAVAPAAPRRRFAWPSLNMLAAMAASFLVALLAGEAVRPWWSAAMPPAAVPSHLAANPPGPAGAGRPLAAPWQMVTVSVPGEEQGKRQSLQLPAMERDAIDDDWLGTVPHIPPQVYDVLQRTGHQVRTSRQLLPVPLDDGRRLVIPMEQIEVRYQGGGGYQ